MTMVLFVANTIRSCDTCALPVACQIEIQYTRNSSTTRASVNDQAETLVTCYWGRGWGQIQVDYGVLKLEEVTTSLSPLQK